MEREFCGSSDGYFKNSRKSSSEWKFVFFWQVADSANAELKFNLRFCGYLRPIWPQTLSASLFLFKYCVEMIFFHFSPIRGRFSLDLILLQKYISASSLNRGLRLVASNCTHFDSHRPSKLPYKEC